MQISKKAFPLTTWAFLLLWLFVGVGSAEAVPARRGLITVRQSDGTTLRVRIYGDEFFHYTVSEEGYTLVADPKGDYYYARLADDGQLVSTGVKARPMTRLSAAERRCLGSDVRKGIRPAELTPARQRMRQAMRQRTGETMPATRGDNGLPAPPKGIGSGGFPTIGKAKGIVVLAQFPDLPFTVGQKADFEELLNSRNYTKNGATGSAWQYYHDNSNGRFDPEFVIVGPYTLPHDRAYYVTDENGDYDSMGAAWEAIVDACQMAYDDGVDFSPFVEADGKLRDVFVFYAGGNPADGSDGAGIWPHRWDISHMQRYLDEQHRFQLAGYACGSELASTANGLTRFTAIGTFCHEFGHVLGWPDFYDTDYETNGEGEGPTCFSLMDQGSYNNDSRTPPALSILERWMVGWAEPAPVDAAGDYRLEPVCRDKGYLIATPTTNDYFLLEYRGTNLNVWDNPVFYSAYEQQPYAGMLVYHVDYTSPGKWNWSNTVNASASHPCYRLVCSAPAEEYAHWYSYATVFPGGKEVTSLSPESNELFRSWSGKTPAYSLSGIGLRAQEGYVEFSAVSNGLSAYDAVPFQRDILVKWTDNSSSRWNITWKKAGETIATTRPAVRSSILLSGLMPGTSYEVTISNQQQESLAFTLATQAEQPDGLPRIGLYREEESGYGMAYLVDGGSGSIQSVKTTIDDTTTGYAPVGTGTHRVRIEITRTDGSVEYLTKEWAVSQ